MRSRLRLFVPLLLTLSLGALLWLGLGNNPYSQDEATLGRTLPAWQSDNLLDGSQIQTASLKGEPFVLNVWASWCTNCRAEHPLLSELAATVPSTVSTTGTRGMPPAPGLSRRATPIALCWPTLTANWPLSSASTARRKPICLMPMEPCSPAIPARLPKGSGNVSLPPARPGAN